MTTPTTAETTAAYPTVTTPDPIVAPEVDATAAAEAEHQDYGTEATDDAKDDATVGREAVRYRVRLRDTEARLTEAESARQAAEDVLCRQRQAILDATLASAGLD